MIEDFWNELNEGEIHVRDNLQFELKSEFFINPHLKHNVYKQEVFLFIPSPLQINSQTYSKTQFYLDQTNLFRYRTPPMTFSQLLDSNYAPSPLNRLQKLLNTTEAKFSFYLVADELKLLGVIFRAILRERIHELIIRFEHPELQQVDKRIHLLCSEVTQICDRFRQLQEGVRTKFTHQQLHRYFKYADEALSNMIEEYFLILLQQIRYVKRKDSHHLDKYICQFVLKEKLYRQKHFLGRKISKNSLSNESILYRQGLLNRFMLEALMLKSQRTSLEEKHSHILGATSAGIAMLVYMILFAWKISTFVINSFPFVALAVFFYILKDRLKDGLKTLYYKQASRWFPDYSTEIKSPKEFKIGKLTENFAFIDPKQLPAGFLHIRNHQFHEELQALQRHESIIQYKREIVLDSILGTLEDRRRELTAIFRLNIFHFIQKASNPFEAKLNLDPYTQEISEKLLPKVYHLNIIIRNTYLQADMKLISEIKTFRVVVDKVGIKRVEQIKSIPEV